MRFSLIAAFILFWLPFTFSLSALAQNSSCFPLFVKQTSTYEEKTAQASADLSALQAQAQSPLLYKQDPRSFSFFRSKDTNPVLLDLNTKIESLDYKIQDARYVEYMSESIRIDIEMLEALPPSEARDWILERYIELQRYLRAPLLTFPHLSNQDYRDEYNSITRDLFVLLPTHKTNMAIPAKFVSEFRWGQSSNEQPLQKGEGAEVTARLRRYVLERDVTRAMVRARALMMYKPISVDFALEVVQISKKFGMEMNEVLQLVHKTEQLLGHDYARISTGVDNLLAIVRVSLQRKVPLEDVVDSVLTLENFGHSVTYSDLSPFNGFDEFLQSIILADIGWAAKARNFLTDDRSATDIVKDAYTLLDTSVYRVYKVAPRSAVSNAALIYLTHAALRFPKIDADEWLTTHKQIVAIGKQIYGENPLVDTRFNSLTAAILTDFKMRYPEYSVQDVMMLFARSRQGLPSTVVAEDVARLVSLIADMDVPMLEALDIIKPLLPQMQAIAGGGLSMGMMRAILLEAGEAAIGTQPLRLVDIATMEKLAADPSSLLVPLVDQLLDYATLHNRYGNLEQHIVRLHSYIVEDAYVLPVVSDYFNNLLGYTPPVVIRHFNQDSSH